MKPALARILWPSFLAAIVAEGVFFSLFDPSELMPFGRHLEMGRMGAYTVGYFAFWAIAALASSMTYLLTREDADKDGRTNERTS